MNNLAKARETIGITQSQLGKMVGFRQSRIANYELNTRKPSLNDARRIVKALNELGANVSLDDVFPVQG
ncbi:helix-turn-helix domain-containing protein [[Haemophilus] felis]|nr:helix-turn-helix domain-containing protein [[Haemophilus] felis]